MDQLAYYKHYDKRHKVTLQSSCCATLRYIMGRGNNKGKGYFVTLEWSLKDSNPIPEISSQALFKEPPHEAHILPLTLSTVTDELICVIQSSDVYKRLFSFLIKQTLFIPTELLYLHVSMSTVYIPLSH